MKISKQMGLSGWVRRVGIGMTALALAATFSMPTSVAAKDKKPASKVAASKKLGKKVSNKASKKASKSKSLAKKTKAAKSRTSGKRHQSAAKKVSRKSTELSSRFAWEPSQEPRQAYYVIPASVAGDAGTPQRQPSFLQPSAAAQNPPEIRQPPPTQAAESGKVHQVGTASYYNDKFDGGRTASGERFDQDKLTCAHGSLPFGCRLRVTNMRNNKAVEVKVNDRGGFSKFGRVIDLSKAAAKEIGMMATGTAKVKVEVLE